MDRCLIVFDMDTKCLEQNYHNSSWRNAYADIQRVLRAHHFTNIQGTVYLSDSGIREAHGTLALQEVAARFPWFASCASNIQFYDIAADFNAQFIVDGVQKARMAFEARIASMREKMLKNGVAADLVDQILGAEQFSLGQMESAPLLQDGQKGNQS